MATSIKISQLPAKGTNLEATDLLEVSEFNGTGYVSKSITGAEIIASVPPTTVDWGDIGGTLSAQTDLQTALNAKVTGNTAITGATKTKITYDSKGLVTAGADATTADIADSLNKRYVTDANLTVIGNTSGVNTGDQTLSGLGGVPTTRTLTINGTTQDLSADRTFTISTGITIGTTAITSGTVGRVLFEGTGNVVQESANLFWDNTNGRLGIGTSSPVVNIDILGSASGAGNAYLRVTRANNSLGDAAFVTQPAGSLSASNVSWNYGLQQAVNSFRFWYFNGTATSTAIQIANNGNVQIGTTTDAGYKLDVNGTARVVNLLTLNSGLTVTAGTVKLQGLAGSGHRFMRVNDNGDVLPINAWNYGNSSGNTWINGADVASSIFTMNTTTQGFLPPRMTTTQKNAIATPTTGLVVFDLTLNKLCVRGASAWETITSL